MKSVAIIPARGGSKRIPRKNIKPFLDRPIISYVIQTAIESGCFDEVMVSTDDEEIAEIARQHGAEVPFMRSAENSTDQAITLYAIREAIESYRKIGKEFDLLSCIYPTAVLTRPESLRQGKEKLIADRVILERRPDPVVGVRMAQERGGDERIVGVSVSMPLPGQYRNKLAEAAIARAQMAQEHAQATRVQVESMALQVALAAASAPSLWQRLADVAQQTQANAALVSRAYTLGEAPLSDTLLARRHAIDALAIAEQAQIDALQSWSRLLLDTHAIWRLHEGHEHR